MPVSRSEVRGFKSPMTHRNFCNHIFITNVALGIFMTMRATKILYSRHNILTFKKIFCMKLMQGGDICEKNNEKYCHKNYCDYSFTFLIIAIFKFSILILGQLILWFSTIFLIYFLNFYVKVTILHWFYTKYFPKNQNIVLFFLTRKSESVKWAHFLIFQQI